MREDKRTRSDYIREIDKLKRVNEILEKSNKELSNKLDKINGLQDWVEDEIEEINQRIELSYDCLGEGGYTLRMYLTYQKNAFEKISKKIIKL